MGKQSVPFQGRSLTFSEHSASCPLRAQDRSNTGAADAKPTVQGQIYQEEADEEPWLSQPHQHMGAAGEGS